MKGIFITLEGLDGAGKTTQLGLLKGWLERKGYRPLFTREPGGTRTGDAIRAVLLDRSNRELSAVAEALLYAASRAQLVAEVIKPALEAGQLVVCDRFLDSSIAYQAYGRGLSRTFVEAINREGIQGIKPTLTLLFDLEPTLGRERVDGQGRSPADRLESENLSFYRRVREGYLELHGEDSQRVKVISGHQPIQAVYRQVLQYVEGVLENWGRE